MDRFLNGCRVSLFFTSRVKQRECHRLLYFSPCSNQALPINKPYCKLFQEFSVPKYEDSGKQAHAHMITSGFSPTLFVNNCLIHMYVKCTNMDYAHKVFTRMPKQDSISWNTIIFGLVKYGSMVEARSMFDMVLERDVITWNTIISGYLQNGEFLVSIELFVQMRQMGVKPDHTSFAIVLKSCAALEQMEEGVQVHALAVQTGFHRDVVTGSAIVDMYAKCKNLEDSHRFFYEMPERNWISWSALIAGYVQNNEPDYAFEIFKEMLRVGGEVCQSTYASVFRLCAGIRSLISGHQVHGHSVKNNFDSDAIVGTAILDMYVKCDCMDDARIIFNLLPVRNLQSWNAMIVGLAHNNQGLDALKLFHHTNKSAVGIDEITLSSVLKACAGQERYFEGKQVHGLAIKTSFILDICVANAILDMYGKCMSLAEAQIVFSEMGSRDIVSWNAIVAAYEQNGNYEDALVHFRQMIQLGMKLDEFTFGSVMKASSGLKILSYAKEIHVHAIKSGMSFDSFVGGALIDMYCKCGNTKEAKKIHQMLEKQTLMSWNSLISGFSMQKQSEEAQKFFSIMLETGINPDNFTYATVLDTCANLACVGLGRQIHSQIIKQDLQGDIYISSTLVDVYSKCGDMKDSTQVFERMTERDCVAWNAMISGFSQHGSGKEALKIFEKMQLNNVKPSHASFLAVLRACGYAGLFGEGLHYFHLMFNEYNLEPQLEHYTCMVDIMGRSGRLDDALKMIHDMPFVADAVIWRTLLSVCKIHKNVKVAEYAAHSILQLEPQDSAAYVLLSNVYAELGLWSEVSFMRKKMRLNHLKKEPGCSWIEVKNEVHTFLVDDKTHPRCEEIYSRLSDLIEEMKWMGYKPDIDVDSFDENGVEEENEQWIETHIQD